MSTFDVWYSFISSLTYGEDSILVSMFALRRRVCNNGRHWLTVAKNFFASWSITLLELRSNISRPYSSFNILSAFSYVTPHSTNTNLFNSPLNKDRFSPAKLGISSNWTTPWLKLRFNSYKESIFCISISLSLEILSRLPPILQLNSFNFLRCLKVCGPLAETLKRLMKPWALMGLQDRFSDLREVNCKDWLSEMHSEGWRPMLMRLSSTMFWFMVILTTFSIEKGMFVRVNFFICGWSIAAFFAMAEWISFNLFNFLTHS